MPLLDGFGRVHDDLRVSVTDRCNLRCAYCLPEEPEWFPREEILRYEEAARLVRVLAGLGVRKVRVTGGSPSSVGTWTASSPPSPRSPGSTISR